MSNSEDNEYRTFSNAMGILLLVGSLVGIFIPQSSVVLADDTEVGRTKSIIAMIQQPSSPDRNRVDEILAHIPLQSPLRPVASQAACIVHIQQGQFADALTCLQSTPANTSSSASLQLSEQRLRLWLLLEIHSTENTELVFKNVVRMAFSESIENSEKALLIEYLGALVGMLESMDQPRIIPDETIQLAKNALENRTSKSYASRYQEKWSKSQHRAIGLLACIAEFERLGVKDASLKVESLENAVSIEKSKFDSIRENVDQQSTTFKRLSDYRKNLLKERASIMHDWNRPTPGKPEEPDEPERSDFDKDEADEYGRALNHYRKELREYLWNLPAKKAAWEEKDRKRKERLQSGLQEIVQSFAKTSKEIEVTKNLYLKSTAELKEASIRLRDLREESSISSIALSEVANAKNNSNQAIRPSRFELVDFAFEESRLTKELRKHGNNP